MGKGLKWRRILAWLLVLTMLWQNAGVEVLAASTVLTGTDAEERDGNISGDVSENETTEGSSEDASLENGAEESKGDSLPADSEDDKDNTEDIPSEGDTAEEGGSDEPVREEEEDGTVPEVEIQPVTGEAEQEADKYIAGEEAPIYWTLEAVKDGEAISLTPNGSAVEGFSDLTAAAGAAKAHFEMERGGYDYFIRVNTSSISEGGEVLSIGSLEGLPDELQLTLDLGGETMAVEANAEIDYSIENGTLNLPESGTVTVKSREGALVALRDLNAVYSENNADAGETLILCGTSDNFVSAHSLNLVNMSDEDLLVLKGYVYVSGEELSISHMELDGTLELCGEMTVGALEIRGTTSGEERSAIVLAEETGYGVTGEHSPFLKVGSVSLADGEKPVYLRKQLTTELFSLDSVICNVSDADAAACFALDESWQRIEAEPADDGTYNLVVCGMDEAAPLWIWQEPASENDSRFPVGSVSTFADAKALIRERAEMYSEEEQESLYFTIDVNQPGMKLSGDALDYSSEKYGVSVAVPREWTDENIDRTLTASGTVTLGGNLYIQGDITGVNAVIRTEVNENLEGPCVNIAGSLKLSGALTLNGELIAETLAVTGTTTALAQRGLHIRKSAILGNLTVKGDGNSFENMDSFRIYLTWDSGKESDNLATLAIRGNVAKSGAMEYPVTFAQENGRWDEEGNFTDEEPGGFAVGTVLAVLTKGTAYVPTSYFRVDDDAQCIVRNSNTLEVSGTAVRVTCGDTTRNYDSLEAAKAGITTAANQNGFGSQKGTYEMTILQDCTLHADVSFPTCVTGLSLNAEVDFDSENPKETVLNLNGKTITVNSAQNIYIGDGLTLYNGKLIANAATEIIANAVVVPSIGTSDEEVSPFNLPVENLTVTAANAEFYLNTALTREYSEEEFSAMKQLQLALNFDRNEGKVGLNVKSFGTGENFFQTDIRLNSLTLNAGASYVNYNLHLDSLSMKASRLYIDTEAALTVEGTVTVSSAYARDTGSRYYTIENNGGFVDIGTLDMTAGTLYNGPQYQENGDNIAYMNIYTVKRVAKLYNEYDAVFRTHSFTQTKSDKTCLLGQSDFIIEDEEDGTPGSALIYNLVLEGNSSIKKSKEAALSLYGTPVYNGTSDGLCTIKVAIGEDEERLKDGDQLLTANISGNFPVDMFGAVEERENSDTAEEQGGFLLYQSGTKILVNKARFVVFKQGVNDLKYLGSFATWTQASACITAMNDATADYYVEVNPEENGQLKIGGGFVLPSKAKSIYFDYTDEDELTPNRTSTGETLDFCTLIYTGNLNLTTNVTFHNFLLKPQVSATNTAPAAVALNARTLEMQCSGGNFSSITGKSGSTLSVTADPFAYGGELTVTGNISGVTNLILGGRWAFDGISNGENQERATLEVGGAVTATNLELYHGFYYAEADADENADSSENGGEWLDTGAAYLDAGSKITLTNVKTYGQDNRISYGGNAAANILYITGTVSSDDDSIAYAGTEEEGGECLYYKTNAIIVAPKALNGEYAGQKVLRASKASSVWFVTESQEGDKQYTTKTGDYIYGAAGEETKPAVRLERYTDTGAEDWADWEIYSYYNTVKEAFAEINTLNDKTKSYNVILQDTEAETTTAAENLTFPSRAAHLFVGTDNSGAEEAEFYFNFKTALTVNCNTEFDNVLLNTPGGGIGVGNYELTFTNCRMADGAKITGITGTASKGVLTLDNTFFEIAGSVSGIGTLVMGREPEADEKLFACIEAKALSVTNIETRHDNCEIAAGVTLTRNAKTTEITKVTPGLTIGGIITGYPMKVTLVEFVKDGRYVVPFHDGEGKSLDGNAPVSYLWGSAYKMNMAGEGEEASCEYKGIYLANAKKVSADMICLNVGNTGSVEGSDEPVGMLYKSGGYITYMSTDKYEAELLYKETDGSDVSTPCLTFADAVTEINNLSAARDYTIELQSDIGTGEAVTAAPTKVTLPSKGKAAVLTITSAAAEGESATEPYTIYYQGNITANTGLKLENVGLSQKVSRAANRVTTWYLPKDIADYYPAGVTLKTAYELVIGKGVNFDEDTPVLLDGSGYAGTLNIDNGVQVSVQKVNNFKTVYVDGALQVSKYPVSYNKNTGVYKYAGGTMSAKTVYLQNKSIKGLSGNVLKVEDTLNVTSDLNMSGAGSYTDVTVHAGKVTVKNLYMGAGIQVLENDYQTEHHCEIISDTSMVVSGTVRNEGKGNVLATGRAAASSAPTLSISGAVTLLGLNNQEDPGNRIIVRVNGLADESGQVQPLVLDSASRLVTASKAAAAWFEADTDCLKEGNTALYQWNSSDSLEEKTGYMLQKVGNYVNVYYASEIVTAAYAGHREDGNLSSGSEKILGYYISFADAVAAVNAQKDKTQDYTIVLLNDVGGNTSEKKPISLTLPSTKATVTIVSEEEQQHTIYYTNSISLKSHLEILNVELAPQKLVNKVYEPAFLDIAAGAYNLHLADCSVAEGGAVRNLTGTGCVTIDCDMAFTGALNVKKLDVGDAAVSSAGNVSVKELVLGNHGLLEGKAAMNIGSIEADDWTEGANPTIRTYRSAKGLSQLTITGKVKSEIPIAVNIRENGASESADLSAYVISYPDSGYQVQVPAAKKLADIKTEYLSYFDFGTGINVVKYNGSVYCFDEADSSLAANMVRLQGEEWLSGPGQDSYESTRCLDLTQAATEIKNLAEPATDYTVVVSGNGGNAVDTNVTGDKTLYSAFVLPAANTCRSVEYQRKEGTSPVVAFLASSGMKAAGHVGFEGLTLSPANAEGTPTPVTVTMSRSNASTDFPSALTLKNCAMTEGAMLQNVSGVKNVSVLTLNGTDVVVKGNVSNADVLDIRGSHLTTIGSVTVNTVRVNEWMPDDDAVVQSLAYSEGDETASVQWDAFGAVTITSGLETETGMENAESYIAANRVAKTPTKPSFVLNGTAENVGENSQPEGRSFRFRVYRYKTSATPAVTSAEVLARNNDIYLEKYMDEPLLIAPKADAGLFVADFVYHETDGTLISYKDLNYSVLNGSMNDMAVRICRYQDGEGGSEGETYAKTFAQAVAIIDKAADIKSSYTMEILKADDPENGYVKTAQSGVAAMYGAMTLPTKAAYVEIVGTAEDSMLTLAYTGKLMPKCDTAFYNLKLIEGSVDAGKNWLPAKEHAPTVDMGSGKYLLELPANDITVGPENVRTVSYTSITAKSGEVLMRNDTTVSGAVNVKNLTLEKTRDSGMALEIFGALNVSGDLNVYDGTVQVIGTKAMTLTNIVTGESESFSGGETPSLELVTYRTALTKTNKVSKTQLTINGQIDVDTEIRMMVYDGTAQDKYGNAYRLADFSGAEENIFLLSAGSTPTEAAKIAVMPKASLEHVTVASDGELEAPLTWKYAKGLYLTDEKYLPIVVTGCVEDSKSEPEQVYEGSFMTWAQAVAEIDNINDAARTYTITLSENIGNNASIGTLTMPAKAKSVVITSDNDNIEEGRAIFFTGTTITLRCPVEFEKVALVAVKKKTSGKLTWYDSVAYKISAGSYNLTMKDMMSGADYEYGTNSEVEWLNATPGVITGNTKAAFIYEQTNLRYHEEGGREDWKSGNLQFEMAGQVTGFGSFSLRRSLDENGSEFDEDNFTELYISSGVSGITNLNVDSNVFLFVTAGSVTAKNAQINGYVSARNFTSTGTLTMSKGCIDVSDYVKNTLTGAVKLNNLILQSVDNRINGRLNKSNQSQIAISGTVSTTEGTDDYDGTESEFLANHAPVIIGLTYYTRADYAQLYDGMLILQSPKSVTSDVDVNKLFAPRYSRDEYNDAGEWIGIDGMGMEPENDTYGLVKSGKSNIVYQRMAVN